MRNDGDSASSSNASRAADIYHSLDRNRNLE